MSESANQAIAAWHVSSMPEHTEQPAAQEQPRMRRTDLRSACVTCHPLSKQVSTVLGFLRSGASLLRCMVCDQAGVPNGGVRRMLREPLILDPKL